MKRILLFLVTNFAILIVASVTLRLLGFEPWLNAQGINFTSLLVFGALLGFGGAFVSLAMSKWTAKKMMGVQLIEQPRSADEVWLVETVRRQAQHIPFFRERQCTGNHLAHATRGAQVRLVIAYRAGRDDAPEAFVKCTGVHRLVSPAAGSRDPDPIGIDFGARLKIVHRTHVLVNLQAG